MLAFKRLICAVDATKQIINEWWDDKSSTVDIIILPPDIVDLLTHDDEVKDNDVMIDFFFFPIRVFFFTDSDNSQDSRGREGTILFHSTTSTRSRTLRHLFATLHVR